MAHKVGQSVMIDNGAYTYWRRNPNNQAERDWNSYYDFCRQWLDFHTTWAVIPDVIDGAEEQNAALLAEWLHRFKSFKQAAPVWHLHESFNYLERLSASFERVCFGSSGEYAVVSSDRWNNRMNEAFNFLCKGSGRPPCWLHLLRGMSLSGSIYPFASVDSTDLARNHHRPYKDPYEIAQQWDSMQCPARWEQQPIQGELISDCQNAKKEQATA